MGVVVKGLVVRSEVLVSGEDEVSSRRLMVNENIQGGFVSRTGNKQIKPGYEIAYSLRLLSGPKIRQMG